MPDFAHLDWSGLDDSPVPFDDGWTNVLFVGRVIPNKWFEASSAAFHVYHTRLQARARGCSSWARRRVREVLTMLHG